MNLNLFSMFNPSGSYMSLNWASVMLVSTIIPIFYFKKASRSILFLKTIKMLLGEELLAILGEKASKGVSLASFSLFLVVSFWNLSGLLPYVFTFSSHLSICLNLSVMFWGLGVIYGVMNSLSSSASHSTPQGSPIVLGPFSVLVETVSLIIRPLTLAVRLMANMVAGHLLMALLGGVGLFLSNLISLSIFGVVMIVFLCLELAVAIIQGYVIMVLVSLYLAEYN